MRPKQPRMQVTLPPALYAQLCEWNEAEGGNLAALAGALLADRIRQARQTGEFI
jgi:hypothetical protein